MLVVGHQLLHAPQRFDDEALDIVKALVHGLGSVSACFTAVLTSTAGTVSAYRPATSPRVPGCTLPSSFGSPHSSDVFRRY